MLEGVLESLETFFFKGYVVACGNQTNLFREFQASVVGFEFEFFV